MSYAHLILLYFCDHFRFRESLEEEIILLRQQIAVFKNSNKRIKLTDRDRLFWIFMTRFCPNWRELLVIVKPETVLRWHRKMVKQVWHKKAQPVGRPKLDPAIIELIARLARENPLWGAPRAHGELLKLGYRISERVVSKYMPKRDQPRPGGDWWTFLKNHRSGIISIDFFTVFTLGFSQIRGFVVLDHDRRKILHVGATYQNSAAWIRNQLTATLPFDCKYDYLICDNDKMYSSFLLHMVEEDFGLKVKQISQGWPWQNAYVERVIGSIRRELLDHVIVVNDEHLRVLLSEYQDYYNHHRTHLSLEKKSPVHSAPPVRPARHIRRKSVLGGLHSIYAPV